MREDPPPDARCRDKFLVQSIAVTPDREMANIASIVSSNHSHFVYVHYAYASQWQNVEKTSKDSIQERKIRVLFLPAADGSVMTPSHSTVNGVVRHQLSVLLVSQY